MKSWRTTTCGIAALVGPLIAQFYPEFANHGNFIGAVGAGLGLMFARDNRVTSEEVGLPKSRPEIHTETK